MLVTISFVFTIEMKQRGLLLLEKFPVVRYGKCLPLNEVFLTKLKLYTILHLNINVIFFGYTNDMSRSWTLRNKDSPILYNILNLNLKRLIQWRFAKLHIKLYWIQSVSEKVKPILPQFNKLYTVNQFYNSLVINAVTLTSLPWTIPIRFPRHFQRNPEINLNFFSL